MQAYCIFKLYIKVHEHYIHLVYCMSVYFYCHLLIAFLDKPHCIFHISIIPSLFSVLVQYTSSFDFLLGPFSFSLPFLIPSFTYCTLCICIYTLSILLPPYRAVRMSHQESVLSIISLDGLIWECPMTRPQC